MCKILQYFGPVTSAPILFGLTVAFGLPAMEDARADPDYRVASGDVNEDGWLDILFAARTKVLIVPAEVSIPIVLPKDVSTIAFQSTCPISVPSDPNCVPDRFAIAAFLSAADIGHASWDYSTYEIYRVDFDGDGKTDFFLRPLLPELPNFILFFEHAADIEGGGIINVDVDQVIYPSNLGVGLGEPGVEIHFEDRNADGRDDLVVERDGVLVGIFLTNVHTGRLALPLDTGPGTGDDDPIADDADMATIDGVWSGFKAALESKDLQRVGNFFTEESKARYVTLYGHIGDDIADLPAAWSNFTPIELSELFALYAFHQDDPSGTHLYRVLFVRVPGYGWRIQEM